MPTGVLDITLYRDDLMRHDVGLQPLVRSTDIPFDLDGKHVLLVEDTPVNQKIAEKLLTRYGYTGKDVKLLIPHQANLRIINAAAERLGLAPEQVVINIEKYGNTTAATIPLATRDALQSGRLKKGDLVLFAGVGAGFTVGANLWRWEY